MADAIEQSKLELLSQNKGFFWEARTRILAWYALLLVCLVGLSIPIFTQLVIKQVDKRVIEDLNEELAEFRESIAQKKRLDFIVPKAKAKAIFDDYLNSRIPADKTFLIATIEGKIYKSSPSALPKVLKL